MLLTSSTDGLLIDDDFEGPDLGERWSHGALQWDGWPSGGDPSGYYVFNTETVNAAPGPVEGAKYGKYVRVTPDAPVVAGFAAQTPNPSTTRTLSLDFMAYIPAGETSNEMTVVLGDGILWPPNRVGWMAGLTGRENEVIFQPLDYSGVRPTCGTFVRGQWQRWQIDYWQHLSGDSYQVTIDDVSDGVHLVSAGGGPSTIGGAGFSTLGFYGGFDGAEFYLDAPEPATLGVLVLGALVGLLRRRR
jgi:hypothetical protein